jgi:hypothetical protein
MSVSDYLADVQRYDSHATSDSVQAIVRGLAIGIHRDAMHVRCDDPGELASIRENWCAKKLGLADPAACDAAISAVCEQMAGDRTKSRVTFCYLVAKRLGRLPGF